MKYFACVSALLLSFGSVCAMQRQQLSVREIMAHIIEVSDAMSKASYEASLAKSSGYDPNSDNLEDMNAVLEAGQVAGHISMQELRTAIGLLDEVKKGIAMAKLREIRTGYFKSKNVSEVLSNIQSVREKNKVALENLLIEFEQGAK